MKTKLIKDSLMGSLIICIILSLFSCKKKNEESAFIPQLDTQTKCKIEIAGTYFNFEALEAELTALMTFIRMLNLYILIWIIIKKQFLPLLPVQILLIFL